MSEYEARIRTKFGELTVHFSDRADLERKLQQISEFADTIEKSVGPILVREPERVMEGLEDIYAIGADGRPKLLKYPKKKTEILRLASFLSQSSLTPDQLGQITGVDNPLAYMGKAFIANPDGTYYLTSEARIEVANRIIPALKGERLRK
jgi:hypothetical protein